MPRILHVGDTTGYEIQHALTSAVRAEPRITLLPATEVLDLVVPRGRCVRISAAKDGEVLTVLGRGVVLATGGLGALYEHTTNPPAATGDGYALALRAGVLVRNLHSTYSSIRPRSTDPMEDVSSSPRPCAGREGCSKTRTGKSSWTIFWDLWPRGTW